MTKMLMAAALAAAFPIALAAGPSPGIVATIAAQKCQPVPGTTLE